MNDTKLKGDIAEYSVLVEALKQGFRVSKPVGDRYAYDLIFERDNKFLKIQIKSAWLCGVSYIVDTRRKKTNRKYYKSTRYSSEDFDYVVIFIQDKNEFVILSNKNFNKYKSGITLDSKRPSLSKIKIEFNNWKIIK